MKNRVFWALNHSSLMETECPLLEKLGYEVYVPKIIGKLRSSSICFDYDKNLTIKSSDLDKLNSFDFYSNKPTAKIADIINNNFNMVFCPSITPLLYNLLSIFKNHFFLRAFGYESNINYESVLKNLSNFSLLDSKILGVYYKFRKKYFLLEKIKELKEKFHLAISYEKIADNETEYFQKRCVYLPIGISPKVWNLENSHQGTINRIMFVCPSIENSYYSQIYSRFVDNFGVLPYTVFGKQNKKYDDSNIASFLENTLYYKAMEEYKLCFIIQKKNDIFTIIHWKLLL